MINSSLTTLSDIIDEISMGPFGSDIKVENFVESGVPVLNGANVTSFKLNEEEFKYVTEEKAQTFKKAIARHGDIVITHRGTLGQISYIPSDSKYDKYVISQSQFRVRLKKDKANPVFLVYYFHTPEGQKRLLSFKNHVGVPALAQATTNFRKLQVPLSEYREQTTIANFLLSLDSKIELNKLINAKLEAITRLVYDYWFLQFNFPNEVNKPYKNSGGKMIWNEELKREIPEGWECTNVAAISSILTRGISPKYVEKGGIMVLNQKCIRNKSINFSFGRRHNHELRKVDTKLIKIGDILVNSTGVGTLGRVAIVKWLEEDVTTVDSHVSIIRINGEQANPYFIAHSLSEKQAEIEQLGEGSTGQTELSRDNLGKLKLLLPPDHIQKAFEEQIRPQLNKIALNERENNKLTELRNWLLPMLMNGQVKVSGN